MTGLSVEAARSSFPCTCWKFKTELWAL